MVSGKLNLKMLLESLKSDDILSLYLFERNGVSMVRNPFIEE